MGTTVDHRKCAEECVAMARLAEDNKDKALWLTLAQSWVRLAEHVAHVGTGPGSDSGDEADADEASASIVPKRVGPD
jgi:hypothetical protein